MWEKCSAAAAAAATGRGGRAAEAARLLLLLEEFALTAPLVPSVVVPVSVIGSPPLAGSGPEVRRVVGRRRKDPVVVAPLKGHTSHNKAGIKAN